MQVVGNDLEEALNSAPATETDRDGSLGLSAWVPIILLRGVR